MKRGRAMAQTTVGVRGGGAKMKKICVEEHWRNPEVGEIGDKWRERTRVPLSNDPKATPHAFPRIGDFEKFRLPLMDEYGIAMQVLASNSPGIQAAEDATTAVGAAKRFNDAQAEIIRKYPGRFAGWASLPTQDPKAAADELERTVTQLGFKGAMIQGHTHWEYLDEKKFWVIWERAEALAVPIYLHVAEPALEGRKIYEGHSELMGPAWSWVVETATHALRIVGGGVFDAFPKASLILGHLGETLPFLLGRLDEGYAMSFKPRKLNKKLSEYVKENIFVTTSGRYKPEALICTINAMGIDRVLFAADYPYAGMKEAVEDVERTPLSGSDKEKIYHLNAERLLRL
ncbi:MAG: amidohydrolase family protein [Desulfobacterales bacterium]|nr:amidohydrolase family protein [Desulfobacterales bacterium]